MRHGENCTRAGPVAALAFLALGVSGASAAPGDHKLGYETTDYETRSLSLEARKGKAADLMRYVEQPPLGLPPIPVPASNPISREKIALGRKLFYDRRLSHNQTQSCAMCHVAEQGFANNELAKAVGIEGRSGRRNAPTIYNVAYLESLFHDGREHTLEQQVWGPLLDRAEMGNPSFASVLEKIKVLPDYRGRFEKVFGRGPTMETLGMALASYERVLVSGDSRFDRWFYGGAEDALSESAKRGFELFRGKGNCAACHTVGEQHALFTDNRMHNTGIGARRSLAEPPQTHEVILAPGVVVDVDEAVITPVGEVPPGDLGRYEVTEDPRHRWQYRTPTLRNVALTAPYMHDGSLKTLEEVIAFYNQGGFPNEVLDPLIRPLGLSEGEAADLVAFLHSLTGSNVERLVSDAFAAPVGNEQADDPVWVRELDRQITEGATR